MTKRSWSIQKPHSAVILIGEITVVYGCKQFLYLFVGGEVWLLGSSHTMAICLRTLSMAVYGYSRVSKYQRCLHPLSSDSAIPKRGDGFFGSHYCNHSCGDDWPPSRTSVWCLEILVNRAENDDSYMNLIGLDAKTCRDQPIRFIKNVGFWKISHGFVKHLNQAFTILEFMDIREAIKS